MGGWVFSLNKSVRAVVREGKGGLQGGRENRISKGN